jgi:tetratricopeptide (TPR) repeat protein
VLSHHGALTDERPTKTRPVQSNTGKRTVVDGVRSLAQLSNTQLKPIADALEPAHATDPISALKAEQRIRIVYAASGILGAGIAGALFAFVEANGARLEAEQNPSPRAQIVTAATPIPDEPEAVPPAPAPATTPPPPTTHLPVPENPEEGVVPADPARMDESAPAMATASAKKAPPSSSKRSSDNRETTARSKTSPPRSTVDAGALAQRGNAAFRRGKYRQAASLLGKAVRQAPGNASYRLSLGDALFRLGSYSAAQQHYDRAAKLGHPSASRRLAKVKSKLGG